MKCRNNKNKISDIRRSAMSLQENNEVTKAVLAFPCLYDKSKREYKDENIVMNAWKEVHLIEKSKSLILSEF